MKNFIQRIILLAAVVSLFAGCDFFWYRYNDRVNKFSIVLPRTWTTERGLGNVILIAKSPLESDKDKFLENITLLITDWPSNVTTNTFYELNKEELKNKITEIYNFTEGEIYSSIGEGKYFMFDSFIKEVSVKVVVCIWTKSGRAFVLTCMAENSRFNDTEPIFRKISRSLQAK